MEEIILGIDQSFTNTGWVVLRKDEDGYEVIDMGNIATSNENTLSERIGIITYQLELIILKHKPDTFVAEALSFGSVGNATRNLAMLFFSIQELIREYNGGSLNTIAPTSVKKIATGSGKAKKKDVLEGIKKVDSDLYEELLSTKVKDGRYDIADAYWIGRFQDKVTK